MKLTNKSSTIARVARVTIDWSVIIGAARLNDELSAINRWSAIVGVIRQADGFPVVVGSEMICICSCDSTLSEEYMLERGKDMKNKCWFMYKDKKNQVWSHKSLQTINQIVCLYILLWIILDDADS